MKNATQPLGIMIPVILVSLTLIVLLFMNHALAYGSSFAFGHGHEPGTQIIESVGRPNFNYRNERVRSARLSRNSAGYTQH